MFDGNIGTYWHGYQPVLVKNTVTVNFHHKINFIALELTARPDYDTPPQGTYQNLCLFIDDAEVTCTPANRVTSKAEAIALQANTILTASKVEVKFQDGQAAIIAKLQIIYAVHGKYRRSTLILL